MNRGGFSCRSVGDARPRILERRLSGWYVRLYIVRQKTAYYFLSDCDLRCSAAEAAVYNLCVPHIVFKSDLSGTA